MRADDLSVSVAWLGGVVLMIALASGCDSDSNASETESVKGSGDGGTSDSGAQEGDGDGVDDGDGDGDGDGDNSNATSGDGDGDGDGDSDSKGVECGDLRCDETASCDASGDEPTCACPDGYKDVDGDGTECDEIDECADPDLNDCARRAKCTNTDGGYKCECRAPAYAGDGRECECAEGYDPSDDDDSLCLGKNGVACEGGLDCASEECVGKICCAQGCLDPDTCQSAEKATCEDGKTCFYPQAEEGATCDDGDNCTDGACNKDGDCIGTPFDVDEVCGMNNPCVVPACDSERGCTVTPVEADTACDDGNPCTVTDTCDGSGSCVGTGLPEKCEDDLECTVDSCEPKSGEPVCSHEPRKGSCTPPDSCSVGGMCSGTTCMPTGNACGAGDPECTAGEPNECTCKGPDYVESSEGICVPLVNDCEENNPCVSDATCTDPSSDPDDATCKCDANAVGDGKTAGSGCTPCASGQKAIQGQCVCDLGGTFAMLIENEVSWPADDFFEGGKSVPGETYALRKHEYDDEGNLTVTEYACGGPVPDLCVDARILTLELKQALGGSIPEDVWDSGTVPPMVREPVAMPNAVPGAPFKTPPVATTVGMTLTGGPLASWPESRHDDGFVWQDADGDGIDGITTFWREGGTSETCPRDDPDQSWDYAYPTAVRGGIFPVNVAEVYGATRVITSFDGTIDDCDTFSGKVEGAEPGTTYTPEARVFDCKLDTGSRCASVDQDIVDFLDSAPQTDVIEWAEFTIRRVPDGTTCAEARELTY